MGDQEFKNAVKTTLKTIGGKWKPGYPLFSQRRRNAVQRT